MRAFANRPTATIAAFAVLVPPLAFAAPALAAPAKEAPGGLYVVSTDGKKHPLVLEHTEVDARVDGNLARVVVTQRFKNPYDKPLEATYAFPLPENAAVDDMRIRVGDRVIVGQIKQRAEAKKIYDAAKAEGRTAALLDQERANLFTQKVANIRPGEAIEVTIGYSDSLRFEGDAYEFFFPTAIGPRYVDPARVPDAAKVAVPALPVGTRSGRDVAISLRVRAGLPIAELTSPTHRVEVAGTAEERVVTLAPDDRIPNRDFVVRYRLAGKATQATVLHQRDTRGGHFAAYLVPAVKYRDDEVVPKDVVFLMDTSGSQDGEPIVQSKALMKRMIDGLNGDDTFAIIDFANAATRLAAAPLPNTAANRARAHRYIDKLTANGGTELMNGIDTALKFPASGAARLRSIVLVTDGLIGEDEQVIARVKQKLPRGNRLFSFGVGSGTNRFLLERLAEVGRGACTIVSPDEPLARITERFYRQINDPVLTNIEVSWEGPGPAPQLYPALPPDLFAAQPLVVFGRKADARPGVLRVRGTQAGGRPFTAALPVAFEAGGGNPAIAQLWGRQRLKQLMRDMNYQETPAGKAAATATALDYRLMSKFTSFVAVTQEVRVKPGDGKAVRVPEEPGKGLTEKAYGDLIATPQSMAAPAPMPQGYAFRAYGDPHVVTGDGLKFDLSLIGEFVGFASRTGDFALHTRVGPGLIDPKHTFNLAVAVRLGAVVVAYDATTRRLTVDGKPLWLLAGQERRLAGGALIRALPRGWELVSAKGDRVWLTPVGDHLDFRVEPGPGRTDGEIVGALGVLDADDRPENDLRDRAGVVVTPPTGPASEGRFLEGWRVTPAERLLMPERLGPLPLPGAGGASAGQPPRRKPNR